MKIKLDKLLFVFILVLIPSIAQSQKYKDVYPQIAVVSDNDAMLLLKTYLKVDPEHPNSNLLLALLYDKNYKGADALTEYEKAMANAERAKLRLVKAQVLVTEKDVKKNTTYYSKFSNGLDGKGQPIVNYQDVDQAISNKYDSVTTFLEKVPTIYKLFVSAVNAYDVSIKTFYKINSRYNSLDDLYLLKDDELGQDLTLLKQMFDSTLFYLDAYKSKIAEYPIKGYNQDYSIREISTYRLSGLIAQSDFLTNNIELWNYGRWVDDVHSVLSSEVSNLRSEIISYDQLISTGLKNAVNPDMFSTFEPVDRNKELLFNLKKFDNNSLLAAIFQYKQSLQFVLHRSHNIKYYDTATNVLPQNKYTYFGEMINSYYQLDSTLKVVKSRLTEASVAKHKVFMDEYYRGYKGVDSYLNLESKNISYEFGKYVLTLRNAIINDIVSDTASIDNTLSYSRKKIPLTVTRLFSYDSVQNGELLTTHVLINADNSKYAAGIYKTTKGINNFIAYVARVSPDNKVNWYKEYNIEIDSVGADSDNFIAAMQLTPAGCAILIRSIHLVNTTGMNTFVYLDENGEELLVNRLPENDYPRTLNFNETTNSFIMTFRGNDKIQNYKNEATTTILNVNVLGDLLWSYKDDYNGTLDDVVNTNSGYILVGNYTVKKDDSGNVFRTKINDNQTKIYLDFISSRGKRENTQLINSDQSIYFANITKVNDSNISIIGYEGILDTSKEVEVSNNSNLVYVFTNSKLQLIYSSL